MSLDVHWKASGSKKTDKSYTIEEVDKHNKKDDCWVIVHNKVYDVTPYLKLHPGGESLLFRQAGQDATGDFEAMFHSPKARDILSKYIIGSVSESALKPATTSANSKPPVPLFDDSKSDGFDPSKGVKLVLLGSKSVTYNTRLFRFALPSKENHIEIPPGRHVYLLVDVEGKTEKRPYTPIQSGKGFVDLMIKNYDDGTVSKHVHNLDKGGEVILRGPSGNWDYVGSKYTNVIMIAGGTGVAPMFQILQEIRKSKKDSTDCHMLFSNRAEKDMLLKKELDQCATSKHFEVTYVLSQPEDATYEPKGRINVDLLKIQLEFKNEKMKKRAYEDRKLLALVCGTDSFNSAMDGLLQEVEFSGDVHIFED